MPSLVRMRRPFAGAFFIASLLGSMWVAGILSGCSRPQPVSEPVRSVKLLEVGGTPVQLSVEYAGEVRARTESRLGFRVGGKLLQRNVEVGQSVRPGQLLAQLDGQDLALAAQAAQAQVVAAATQHDLAQADWQRYAALKEQGFISAAELDRRKASVQSAKAQLDQARAQAAAQANQSGYARLLADAAGVVIAVGAEAGQVLSAGAPVVTLAVDGPRDAVFAVPENARAQMVQYMQHGVPVQVRPWNAMDHAPWTATVREVAASADPSTRTYAVKVAIQPLPDKEALPLGATVYVKMSAHAGAAVKDVAVSQSPVRLPLSAVRQQADGSAAVWVFDAQTSTVHSRVIEIAQMDGNDLVLSDGLEPGEQIVAAGTHVLSEGQSVTVYQAAHPEAAQ